MRAVLRCWEGFWVVKQLILLRFNRWNTRSSEPEPAKARNMEQQGSAKQSDVGLGTSERHCSESGSRVHSHGAQQPAAQQPAVLSILGFKPLTKFFEPRPPVPPLLLYTSCRNQSLHPDMEL